MKRRWLFALGIAALLVSGFVLMRSIQAVLPFSLGVDLVPRWVGTDAILEGISPYSPEARQRTWRVIYGADEPQGNVFGFYYPPAITTLLMPFVLAGIPLDIATASFSALIWSAWLATLLFASRTMPVMPLALFLISGIFFRPAFSNYILGQNALLGVITLGAAYLFIQKQKWESAGFLLALSLLKPSFMLLPVGILLIMHPQRKLWMSFILLNIILNSPSFLLIGWWIPDFLKEISVYALENRVAWSSTDILSLAGIIWLALSGYLISYSILKKDHALLISSALAFNAALTPHTADYDLVVFLGILAWLMSRSPFWLILLLVWFPWGSLALIPDVEIWYRFIWITYPVLLLSLAAGVAYRLRQQPIYYGK